jgi:hypothetical protein
MVGLHLVRSDAASDIRDGEDDSTIRGLRIYAARSECGDVCSIETGVRLVLLCLLVNRIRVLLASLKRAHRNASMNKAAGAASARECNWSDHIKLRSTASIT